MGSSPTKVVGDVGKSIQSYIASVPLLNMSLDYFKKKPFDPGFLTEIANMNLYELSKHMNLL